MAAYQRRAGRGRLSGDRPRSPAVWISDRPGSYTREDQASRINDVLDALKAEPAIIVGHSFGAERRPNCDAISGSGAGLVLVDAALGLSARRQPRPG